MSKPLFTLLLAGIFCLPSTELQAQNDYTTFNWKFEEACKRMDEKFYDKAAELWQELVESNPEHSNLNWKLGHAYFESASQRSRALPYLEKAAERRNDKYSVAVISDYDKYDAKEKNAPPEVDYYLARCYHLNYDLDKAELYYQKFIDQRDEKHELHKSAYRGLQQVDNARQLMASPKNYPVENLGNVINSPYPDFSPVISLDGNSLFFTSRRVRPDSSNNGVIDDYAGFPYEDIYVSYKDREGKWQNPEVLNINTEGHLASINVSADGQRLFMYRDDGGDGNIYESRLIGEQWSDPVLLEGEVNSKSWETHAALSADENTIFFVSDRGAGNLGGRDIYRVVRLPNGEWSKAQSLGGVVNTPFDEDAPFIHPDGRRLFFSSQGHNSMGGFDIFYSEKTENGTWSIPKNLGYPLNTVDDDVFFVTSADGRSAFYSSNKEGGFGEKDIYQVALPVDMESEGLTVLKGMVVPPAGQNLPATTLLRVTDRETGEVKNYRPRSRDGVYVAILPPCREYNLDYQVNGESVHTEDIYVECETAYQEINKEIYLNPVSLTQPAEVKEIQFIPPAGQSIVEQNAVDPTATNGVPVIPTLGGEGTVKTAEETEITTAVAGVQEGTTVVRQGEPGVTTSGTGTGTNVETEIPVSSGTSSVEAMANESAEANAPNARRTTAAGPADVPISRNPVLVPGVSYNAEYSKFYEYDAKDINRKENEWQAFISKLGKIIESKGSVDLIIEASASKVPTSDFNSNEELSKFRLTDARRRLKESLESAGIDPSKVFIAGASHVVQGPNYKGDAIDIGKYGMFQYVKFRAK